MRILHIDSGREMRGGQWQVWYLLSGLRARGHEVKLLARAGGVLMGRAAAAGLDVTALSVPSLLRARGWADVVHVHDARSHSWAAVLLRRGLVVSRRVVFPVGAGLLSRRKYGAAAHYIAISRCVAAQLVKAGIKPEIISVVYDGAPEPPPAGLLARNLVVAPATADPMKGSGLAREAAALAGIEIVFSHDLQRDLDRAAVFVYITRSEGLGSAVLLAMAHGVPVVASRVGGLVEVIESGTTGVLVDNTATRIAGALRSLLDDEGLRVRLGQAGREQVKRHFSLDSMVEGTLKVYEKVHA